MSKRYYWILPILTSIIIISAIIISIQNKNTLPDSFTIKFYGDWTSSGASRTYNATLTFADNKLTYGWQRYESWDVLNRHNIYECTADTENLTWIDSATGGDCGYQHEVVPLTKVQLEETIKTNNDWVNKPLDKCWMGGEFRYNTCYEIIK
jgi:hypothetical protein